jgi:hypothetical protein
VKLSIKTPGSIVLSALASFLSLLAFFIAYTVGSDWAIVLWWVILPPLLLFDLAYVVADLARSATRKQAALAVLLAAPASVAEVWFFKTLRL